MASKQITQKTHTPFFNYAINCLCIALLGICAPLMPLCAQANTQNNFHLTADDEAVTREVAQSIRFGHYEEVFYDQAFSHKAFDRLLALSDPEHVYLFSSDIDRFQNFYNHFAEDFEQGNLEQAYMFYAMLQDRMQSRIQWLIEQLKTGPKLDYNTQDNLQVVKNPSQWAPNFDALNGLWHKRLLSSAIMLKLTEPKLSDQAIVDRLIKRHELQLSRLRQARGSDVLTLFLAAATTSIDPHTEYMSPDQSESFDIQMRLSLDGIGAMLQSDDEYVKIVQLVPGGPADKSGQLHPADRIVAVSQTEKGDWVSVLGMRLDDVIKLIRGPKDSVIRLEIVPSRAIDMTQTRVITLKRDKVNLEDQAAQSKILTLNRDNKTYKIGIIKVPAFYVDFAAWQAGKKDYRSTTRDVKKLLEELSQKHVDGVILDMRGDGGGALQEANSMVGLFVDRGPSVQVRDARGRINLFGNTTRNTAWTGPLAVLIDRLSASASEIFAGAIQDYGRGLIIGSRSFGKGTVQTLSSLTQGELRMTRAKFYRITGESTQERGVIPDIRFPSFIDDQEFGESALPNALPWDQIRPVSFQHWDYPQLYFSALRQKHEARIQHEANFIYLQHEAKFLEQMRAESERINLNLSQRRQEKESREAEQLTLENQRRKALGLKPLQDWSEVLDDEEKNPSNSPIDQAYLHESAEVLLDYVQMQHP